MKILITGNQGYIGPVLSEYLKRKYPESRVIGYDSGFYALCATSAELNPDHYIDLQYRGDIREIHRDLLVEVDAVIHLAAISNDPIGNELEVITDEINREATVRLARLAIEAKVKHFVFASSCSVYGLDGGQAKTESSEVSPLTAYAKSKIFSEKEMQKLDHDKTIFTILRFATACGWSSRLRLDLVLNDFVASAISTQHVHILSDGSPWRPLIDVRDMSRAIDWAITRDKSDGGQFLILNTGSTKANWQVKELAECVASEISGVNISINAEAQPDKRSYRVDFSLFENLAPKYTPKISLEKSINNMQSGLLSLNFNDKNFRNSNYVRLNVIRSSIERRLLSKDLRWLL